jgi:hypothetical protein
MAPVVTQGIITNRAYANWYHAFQNQNTQWISQPNLIAGDFFIGLQGSYACIYQGHGIPKGSTILSATADFYTSSIFQANAIDLQISTIDRDTAISPQRIEPFKTPDNFEGWRRETWGTPYYVLRNNVGVVQSQLLTAPNATWGLRQVNHDNPPPVGGPTLPMRDRTAIQVTVTSAFTLGDIDMRLYRVGVLPFMSFVRCRVYPTQIVGGIQVPDETGGPLATSGATDMSTFSTNVNNIHTFPFFGGNQITLNPGNYFFVVEPDDYPVTFFSFLAHRYATQFFGSSIMWSYGQGQALDFQNYPSTASLSSALNPLVNLRTALNVNWLPPNPTSVNELQTTPDLTSLIQYQIDNDDYDTDQSLNLIVYPSFAQAGTARRYYNYNVGAGFRPVLNITYEPPADIPPGGDSSKRGFQPLDPHIMRLQQEDEDVLTTIIASVDRLY